VFHYRNSSAGIIAVETEMCQQKGRGVREKEQLEK
jgi:hypothetical protein